MIQIRTRRHLHVHTRSPMWMHLSICEDTSTADAHFIAFRNQTINQLIFNYDLIVKKTARIRPTHHFFKYGLTVDWCKCVTMFWKLADPFPFLPFSFAVSSLPVSLSFPSPFHPFLSFLADRTTTQYDRLSASLCRPAQNMVCNAVHCSSQDRCTGLKVVPVCS